MVNIKVNKILIISRFKVLILMMNWLVLHLIISYKINKNYLQYLIFPNQSKKIEYLYSNLMG